jgi:uncharacterized protein (TIRG00374 family)
VKYLRWLGLLLFVVLLLNLDLTALVDALSRSHALCIVVAVALNGLLVGLKAWRWQSLLRLQGQSYSVRRATVVYFSTLFVGYLTPGRVGEFAKALYLAQDTGMSVSSSMSSVLVDRLFDLFVLLASCASGLVLFTLPDGFAAPAVGLLALLVGVLLLMVHPRAEVPLRRLVERLPGIRRHAARLVPAVRQFYSGMASLWRPSLAFTLLLTIAAYVVFFSQCYLLALGLDLPLSASFVVFAVATASLTALLPVSISGLGTRDAVLIALFGTAGLGAEKAVAYSMLILLVFYVASGTMGGVAWLLAPLDSQMLERLRATGWRHGSS